MRRTRVKICGLRNVETAQVAVAAGADAIGLMFVPGSPREVSAEQAQRIITALPCFVSPVGVFVDRPIEQVRDIAAALGIVTVQLHGRETAEDVARLAPLRVIRGVSFETRSFDTVADPWRDGPPNLVGLLLDAPPPPDRGADEQKLTGGHGQGFDWEELATARRHGLLTGLPPVILAGGLDEGNVGEAMRSARPYAVDVSSGVESARGVKDPLLIRSFIDAVRQAEISLDSESD